MTMSPWVVLSALFIQAVLSVNGHSTGLAKLAAESHAGLMEKEIEFLMPQVQPTRDDTYLCVAMKMDEDASYITGYKPHANSETVHHMLLYGCKEPGSYEKIWECGHGGTTKQFNHAGVCAKGQQVLYAWALDAPELKLPQGVSFEVGGESSARFLVLQVHYKDVTLFLPPYSMEDSSGVSLIAQTSPTPKMAGVYVMASRGIISPHSTVFMEAACPYKDEAVMHPFAFRTHTHKLGKVVSGYRIRDGQWTEIGRKNPQLPQMFYDVTTPDLDVKTGDILAARCSMKNEQNRAVHTGPTHNDEMCNFYIMYYLTGDERLHQQTCSSLGPPFASWATSSSANTMNLPAVPLTASIVPDTGEIVRLTSGIRPPTTRTNEMTTSGIRPPMTRTNQMTTSGIRRPTTRTNQMTSVIEAMLDRRRGGVFRNMPSRRWQWGDGRFISQ